MLATPNLGVLGRHAPRQTRLEQGVFSRLRSFSFLFLICFLIGRLPPLLAQPSESFSQRTRRIFNQAQQRFEHAPNDVAVAWQFGRAAFDWADFAPNSAQRAKIAEKGIAACRTAIRLDPKSTPAYYYLALNLGQLAQTKSLGALKLVEEMEKALKSALALDQAFDYAGPYRSLGLLYQDAPGWPISVGNRGEAEKCLLKAVELSPEYPDNQMVLLEAYLKWNEPKVAKTHLPAAIKALEEGREKFNGPQWTSSWEDWDRRLEKVKKRLERH